MPPVSLVRNEGTAPGAGCASATRAVGPPSTALPGRGSRWRGSPNTTLGPLGAMLGGRWRGSPNTTLGPLGTEAGELLGTEADEALDDQDESLKSGAGGEEGKRE